MNKEIGMNTCPFGYICKFLSAAIKGIFNKVFFVALFLINFGYLLLSCIGWISYYAVKPPRIGYLSLFNAECLSPCLSPFLRQLKALVINHEIKEILFGNVWIVFDNAKVINGKIDSCKMSGKFCYVHTPETLKNFLMYKSVIHQFFMLVSPDKKCPCSTGWVNNFIILMLKAEF